MASISSLATSRLCFNFWKCKRLKRCRTVARCVGRIARSFTHLFSTLPSMLQTGLFEWSPIPESPFVQESVGMVRALADYRCLWMIRWSQPCFPSCKQDQPVDEVEDDVTAEEEADGDLKPSKPESAGPHSATLTAVLNFVQHGRDVPPKLLQSVMLRRKLRAAQRCRYVGLFPVCSDAVW